MPLKLHEGTLVAISERDPADNIVSLEEWLSGGAAKATGVRLAPEDDVRKLAKELSQPSIIEVSYPVYTDGRGHSQARMLRDQLSFGGEIRAVGDVRPDQVQMMIRCGIDAFGFDDPKAEQATIGSPDRYLGRYSSSYQRGYAALQTAAN